MNEFKKVFEELGLTVTVLDGDFWFPTPYNLGDKLIIKKKDKFFVAIHHKTTGIQDIFEITDPEALKAIWPLL